MNKSKNELITEILTVGVVFITNRMSQRGEIVNETLLNVKSLVLERKNIIQACNYLQSQSNEVLNEALTYIKNTLLKTSVGSC